MICRVIISLIYAYPNRLFARFFPPYSFYNILPVNIYQGDYAYVFDYKKDQYIQINLVLGALDFDTSDDEPFFLQCCEETLCTGIVIGISTSAHAAFDLAFFKIVMVSFAAVLTPAITMKQ